MNCIHFPLPFNFYFELAFLYQIRYIKDGLTLFNIKAGIDRYKSEHNPSFHFQIMLFNINVIELNIYKCGDGEVSHEQ